MPVFHWTIVAVGALYFSSCIYGRNMYIVHQTFMSVSANWSLSSEVLSAPLTVTSSINHQFVFFFSQLGFLLCFVHVSRKGLRTFY